MRYVIITGLMLCAGASMAMAEPLRLSSAQIDQITPSSFASTLVAGVGRVEIQIKVARDGELPVTRRFTRAVPSVPANVELSLEGMGEKVASHMAGSLPEADLPDVRPVDLPTIAIDVPRPATLAEHTSEVGRVERFGAPVALDAPRSSEVAPPSHFQRAEFARSIEVEMGQLQAASPPAANSGFTVQKTSVVARSPGFANATATNVNITR
jgi:hypothetical protein